MRKPTIKRKVKMREITSEDIRKIHERIDSIILNQMTKQDFTEINNKIDGLFEGQGKIAVSIAQIETTQKLTPKVILPERPCPDHKALSDRFDKHLIDHKENLLFWASRSFQWCLTC